MGNDHSEDTNADGRITSLKSKKERFGLHSSDSEQSRAASSFLNKVINLRYLKMLEIAYVTEKLLAFPSSLSCMKLASYLAISSAIISFFLLYLVFAFLRLFQRLLLLFLPYIFFYTKCCSIFSLLIREKHLSSFDKGVSYSFNLSKQTSGNNSYLPPSATLQTLRCTLTIL